MLKKLLFAVALVVFASAMSAQTFIWEENFDAAASLPAGWTQVTSASDGGWKIGKPGDLSSSFFGVPDRPGNVAVTNDDGCGQTCNKSNDLLITPAIDLSAQSGGLFLAFDVVYYDEVYQGIQETFKVAVSEDGGTTWTDLGSVPGSLNWSGQLFDISSYAGKSNLKFGFRYSDGGGWLYGAALDDVRIAIKDDIVRAKAGSLQYGHYITAIPDVIPGTNKILADDQLNLSATMINSGFPTITSFDATLTYGGESVTKSFSNLSVGYHGSYSFNFDNAIQVPAGDNDISFTISNINGGTDDNPADNVYSEKVTGIASLNPARKVVGEEATGTWCQWCPRGAVMMEYMSATYPDNFIGIAVHNADPMVVTAYDNGVGTLISGYPSGLIDRINVVDPTEFERDFLDRVVEDPKVLINQQVTFDSVTRVATVYSKLSFQEELNGDYRLMTVFTEDGVKGTASGYIQKNAYSGGAAGPMGGYENLPASIPAAQMVYDHVARALIGGFYGATGSVPAANPAGSDYYSTVTYTIPAAYKVQNMHAVTILVNNDAGEFVNAESTRIPNVLVGSNEPKDIVEVKMFPNPVVDEATIELNLLETSNVQVRIMDATGRVVVDRFYPGVSGQQQLPFRVGKLASGSYMLTVTAKGQRVTKPFVIMR